MLRLAHDPDTGDLAHNKARRDILARVRGFGRGHGLFEGLADNVTWRRFHVSAAEVGSMLCANRLQDWLALAPLTRTVAEGAANVRRINTPGNVRRQVLSLARQLGDDSTAHFPSSSA